MSISKYKVLKPIGYGGRQEKGTIIDMDDDTAKAYGPEYVIAYKGSSAEDEATDVNTDKDIEEMSLAELKATAKAMGLPTAGSKADLQERIALAKEDAE